MIVHLMTQPLCLYIIRCTCSHHLIVYGGLVPGVLLQQVNLGLLVAIRGRQMKSLLLLTPAPWLASGYWIDAPITGCVDKLVSELRHYQPVEIRLDLPVARPLVTLVLQTRVCTPSAVDGQETLSAEQLSVVS